MGDGEAATVELWRRAGLRVLPGAYLSADSGSGENPGNRYIRVAMVHDKVVMADVLGRMAETL